MFTDVLISVLRSEFEKKSIQLLTVQSLADRIKGYMYDLGESYHILS